MNGEIKKELEKVLEDEAYKRFSKDLKKVCKVTKNVLKTTTNLQDISIVVSTESTASPKSMISVNTKDLFESYVIRQILWQKSKQRYIKDVVDDLLKKKNNLLVVR